MRRPFAHVGLAALLLIVSLAVAEAVAWILLPRTGLFPPGLFVADEARGLAMQRGFSGVVTRAGHGFIVAINSRGYRDLEWPVGAARRLLVIGSSATFGVGLERDDGITARLAQEVGGGVAVLNTGTYAYGPPQILATLDQECAGQKPEVVLYLHEYKGTRHDFLEPRPFNANIVEAEPSPPWGMSLVAVRALLSTYGLHPRQLIERMIGLDRLSAHYRERYITTRGPGFAPENDIRTGEYVLRMAAVARDCGAEFRIAILPGPAEAYYGLREPASQNLIDILKHAGAEALIIDTRSAVPLGSNLFLTGIDYFSTSAAAHLAKVIAAHLSFPGLAPAP